ncbi:MAG: glycine betaine/L-proline ABC transporter substrate-binding protein ProX [Cyanobacteria bacterium SID2]|nr:glycine betaine/L-proline ABC transporter substrate-binding protein ProX [Cyanobacteria bacterium SID2]MBP0002219.1 glycine betaine/L-proline ABC transporter substrate-binding protein ProX [Cyanobacteria bacterium SBC]
MTLHRLRSFFLLACCVVFVITSIDRHPAASEVASVRIARGTWETGWFQAEVVKQLIEELGYRVSAPQTLEPDTFYRQAARGEVDLWFNGWFPAHDVFFDSEEIGEALVEIDSEVKGRILQGYLVDRATAERLDLDNLEDLRDPEIAKIFDRNGNGKADLIGCDRDWSCQTVVEHHLDVYGLRDTVEQVSGNYAPTLRETFDRHRSGQPVLFYAWMPHWSLGTLVPGRDVQWLEVPFFSTPPSSSLTEPFLPSDNVTGCRNDPCELGFAANTVRVVANREFIEANPAIERLLDSVEIPIEDIVAQNLKMADGEDTPVDIVRHGREWLDRNRDRVDRWLERAREADIPNIVRSNPTSDIPRYDDRATPLRVATKIFEPFAIYKDRQYEGFSIELWESIAARLDLTYRLEGVGTLAKLLDDIERGQVDIAVSGISITAERERRFDFSYPFFQSGLQVMVSVERNTLMGIVIATISGIVISPQLYYGIGGFVTILFVVAHIIWLVERRNNPDFPSKYWPGIGEAFWWAAVTVTTVGYGDKTPKRILGKLFALVWMCVGYFVFAYFIATMTTTFTLDRLNGSVRGPEDLDGHRVGSIERSTAAQYLANTNAISIEYPTATELYEALLSQQIDAVVGDAPALQYYANHDGKGQVKVVGSVFKREAYGFAFPEGSPYLTSIEITLLELMEDGTYDKLHARWFGNEAL